MVGLSPEGIKASNHHRSFSDISDPEDQMTAAGTPMAPPPPSDDDTDSKKGVSIGNTKGANLPVNWSTAVSQEDGRVYYWNSATGATSWIHPNFFNTAIPSPPSEDNVYKSLSNVPSMGDASGILEARSTTRSVRSAKSAVVVASGSSGEDFHAMIDKDFPEYDPSRPINSHRMYSIVAFILFFPLGIFALYQSCNVVSKWKQQKYELAHDKSQQVLLYSRISCAIGICFWVYLCFFSGPGPFHIDVHWPWPIFA